MDKQFLFFHLLSFRYFFVISGIHLLFFIWLDDLHFTQSSGERNIKSLLNLWKLALRGHLNTDAQARDRTLFILITRTLP